MVFPIAPHAHVAGAWQILEVASPRDILGLKEVHNGRHVLGNAHELSMVQTKVVTPHGSQIVRLAGMRDRIVTSEEDALLLQALEMAVLGYFCKVLFELHGHTLSDSHTFPPMIPNIRIWEPQSTDLILQPYR